LERYYSNSDLIVSDGISVSVQSGAVMSMPVDSLLQVNGRLHTSGTINADDLDISGLVEINGVGEIRAEGIVTNTGQISHTVPNVPSGMGTDFAFIKDQAGAQTKYYGITITPTAGVDMGATTVSLRGEQPACNTGNDLVQRCFDITPSNSVESTVRFWYLLAERNGNDETAMNAYHWNGSAWDELIDPDGVLRGTSGDYAWLEVNGIGAFSPFGLASNAPTAVQLKTIHVASGSNWFVIMIVTCLMVVSTSMMLWIWQYKKQKA
jgi:hypothetical protein